MIGEIWAKANRIGTAFGVEPCVRNKIILQSTGHLTQL